MPFEFHLPSLEQMRATPEGLEMVRMMDDDNFHSALIGGGPGTGKTTIFIQVVFLKWILYSFPIEFLD